VWERPQLSKRDRSLVTVSALIVMNRPEQLRSHFVRARENAVTQEELVELITHLAFYAGWPNAMNREFRGKGRIPEEVAAEALTRLRSGSISTD
jgi:alkylhydroperoxidase/carboxymuconolactone decarboxylase family protein YurZ